MNKKIVASGISAPWYHGAEKYEALNQKEFDEEVLKGQIKVLDNFFDGCRVIDGKRTN